MLGIYCRISKRKGEGKDVSIPTQKDEGIRFALSIGENYRVFVDEGISGTKDKIEDRPEFAELLQAIDKKEVTGVFCIDQSRLERNPKTWQLFQFIVVSNKAKFYPAGKETDLNDPTTRLVTGVVSLTNELYASLTSKKVKLAINKNAIAGKSHGITAYGYKKGDNGYLQVDEEKAKIIKKIYQLSLTGHGSYSIANMLNEENVPTKFNGFKGEIKRKDEYTGVITTFKKANVKWRGNVVYDMIVNPIYKGLRQWKNEEIKVPAIIGKELWEQVNANLQKNKKNVGRKEQYNYLLNGIIFCQHCGSEIRGKKRLKGNDNAYKCMGKRYPDSTCNNSRGISIPKLETFIITHLFISKDLKKFLDSLTFDENEVDILSTQLTKNKVQLHKTERRIGRSYEILMDPDYINDRIVKDEIKRLTKKKLDLANSIEFIENKINERTLNNRKTRVNKLLNEYSTTMDFNSIKKLVHSLVDRIIIKHMKNEKGGSFLVTIIYKGFEECVQFKTDWSAMSWTRLQRIQKLGSNKTTEVNMSEMLKVLRHEDERESINLKAFTRLTIKPLHFVRLAELRLMKGELITFD